MNLERRLVRGSYESCHMPHLESHTRSIRYTIYQHPHDTLRQAIAYAKIGHEPSWVEALGTPATKETKQ